MSKIQQILEMAGKFEKLAFEKKAGNIEKLANLAMSYETSWQFLEDLAAAQFYIIGEDPNSPSDPEDPLFKNATKVAEVIRSIIPAVKALDEEVM
jgi:hypothetical protein